MSTAAATRALLVAAWDAASANPAAVTRLDGAPVPLGYTAWRVGAPDGPGSVTALPTLSSDAPLEVHARYLARVRADALGRCPLCNAVAGAHHPDPSTRPAAFAVLPLTVPLRIEHGTAPLGEPCPAIFTDADRRWFPLYADEDDR